MSANHFHTVVQLNNNASDDIIVGNYDKAIKDLSAALKASKQVMTSLGEACLDASKTPSLTLDDCMRQESFTTRQAGGGSDCFNVYHLPIHVKTAAATDDDDVIMKDSCCNDGDAPFNIVSSAILFNLALAHHLAAKQCQRQHQQRLSSTKLKKAARLYELASHLEQKRFDNGSNPLFMMTIVNNLGAIYHELNEHENAQRFFQHLLSTMLFITEYSKGSEQEKIVSDDVNEIFFNNVMHLIFNGGGKNYCTAAAA